MADIINHRLSPELAKKCSVWGGGGKKRINTVYSGQRAAQALHADSKKPYSKRERKGSD